MAYWIEEDLLPEDILSVDEPAERPFRRLWQALRHLVDWPKQVRRWFQEQVRGEVRTFQQIRWDDHLSVRKGFLVGVLIGFSAVGSTLWALSSLPYFTGRSPEPVLSSHQIPIPRFAVPTELSWFFIQFPYVSPSSVIRQKNNHTFIINDKPHRREYVIVVGQQFRRVEIYRSDDGTQSRQVQVFTPGAKKIVWFNGPKVVGQSQATDGNLWMWRGPLWNAHHLKIYGLADSWLYAPYKKYSCAGFVHRFLFEAGIRVPILDAWDLARQPWKAISREEMEPGDIITIRAASRAHQRFWRHRITHVGVYIGNGKMIHASSDRRSKRAWVRIANLDDFRGRLDKILRPPELL
ncbi:MAG: NlpC/P60 family protein [Elusimicrobiota bacterium]|jgi:hypothetical protein